MLVLSGDLSKKKQKPEFVGGWVLTVVYLGTSPSTKGVNSRVLNVVLLLRKLCSKSGKELERIRDIGKERCALTKYKY